MAEITQILEAMWQARSTATGELSRLAGTNRAFCLRFFHESRRWFLQWWLGLFLTLGWARCTMAQTPSVNGVWFYTLVNGSQLIDDCPICDRVTIPVPMGGTFQLRLLGQGPLFTDYAVENVSFTAGQTGGRVYRVSGHGTYRIGG